MPNWKKVIVSGSDASLNSLNVATYISASTFNGKFTGSLQGSSSYALTSSYALYAAVAPNLGTTTTFTQAASASTWTFTHNLNTLTPQITVYDYGKNVIIPQNIQSTDPNTTVINFNASQSGYAVIGTGGGLVITGSTYNFTQASASNIWYVTHPLNTKTPIVQVYDANYNSILTEYISGSSNSLLTIDVGTAQTGYAVLSNGGNLFISGSSARLTQSVAAVTWSFTHSLNTKYPIVQVYDANDSVIVPATITAIDTNTTQITFATPTTGVAVAEFSGIQGLQDNTVSSSYAATASIAISSSYAATASSALNASDILVYVKNSTGTQIDKGTVVRINGAVGDNPLISTASYTDDNNSANTLGITNENIANDSFGYVMTEGKLLGIDTSLFTVGQLLYLGANGAITGSAPQAPLHAVRLGQVLRVQLNNGSMYIRIDNGFELGELHDVLDTSTTSSYGDLLVRSGSVWTNSRQLTGSYRLTGSLQATSFTGSLFGTSSWAQNAVNAPFYTLTSSFLAFTSSVNATTGALNSRTGSYATTGSNTFSGSQAIYAGGNYQASISGTLPTAYTQLYFDASRDYGIGVGNSAETTFGVANKFFLFDHAAGAMRVVVDENGNMAIGNGKSTANAKLDVSGSVAVSGALNVTGALNVVGPSTLIGNQTLTGDLRVQGNLIAQTFIISSSVSYFTESFSSGSTKFGDDSNDLHQFTGSVRISGSFDVTGSVTSTYGFTGSLFGTSSWAQNAVAAPYYVLTSSFTTYSSSISTRVTNLESTASVFVVASASFSSSIVTLTNASASFAAVSTSYAVASASLSSRVSILETASGSLSASVATLTNASASFALQSGSNSTRLTTLTNASASFALQSGSNSTRLTTLENASASFALQSGSNSTRFTALELASGSLSASLAVVSSSYANLSSSFRSGSYTGSFSGSFSGSFIGSHTGSYTGSFVGPLAGTASQATSASYALSSSYSFSGSYALTASYVASIANLSTTQIATGSVTASVSGSDATFRVVSGSNTFLFVSSSGLTTVSGTFAVTVNNVNEFLISSTGSSLGNALTDIHSVTGSLRVNGNITGSMFGTSSFAVSASNALTASFALSTLAVGQTPVTHTQAASSSTWAVTHSLGSLTPNITIYDFGYNVIIPQNIKNTSINSSTVTFSSPQSGYAVFSVANQVVSGSTAVLSQSSAATTWSFSHNLNSRFVNVDVYGSDFSQIIPARLTLTNSASVEITFAAPTTGYAVATINGFSGSVTSAQNDVIVTDTANATRYVTWTDTTSGIGPSYASTGMTFNPSTNALTVGTLTETSTIELKTNIKDFTTPLAKFMALQPVSYKWKENKRKDIGFIAEHVQELFPEIVADDGKSMSYTKLTPILIDIVQRQQETIEEMRKELKAIKKHIDKH